MTLDNLFLDSSEPVVNVYNMIWTTLNSLVGDNVDRLEVPSVFS